VIPNYIFKFSGRPFGVPLCAISATFGCSLANGRERDLRSVSHRIRSVPWLDKVPRYLTHLETELGNKCRVIARTYSK
jgi:hypothetical protein